MKKIISSLVMVILALVSVNAQQISVVSPDGETTIYRTFPEAIEGAADGSVVYLPGGGFSISDDVKITKKLTIIGIGHYTWSGNVDGVTTIAGNLFFNEGSSGSAVMACYITGNVIIGDDHKSVKDMLIRFCNLNSVSIRSNNCLDNVLNQSYLRNPCDFGGTNICLENNILHSAININGGIINHNIIVSYHMIPAQGAYPLRNVSNSSITNNFLLDFSMGCQVSNCSVSNNCRGNASWGDNAIVLEDGINWDDVFLANNGINVNSDYHLKGEWGKNASTDGSDLGIYGGSGFNDNQMAPVPYIIYKDIPEQTDSEGKLKIQIRVKANQ